MDRFHAEHAGITETVLAAANDGEGTPYEWLVESIGSCDRVLDLACGSGPLQPLLGPGWFGVDLSEAELALARTRPSRPSVLLADAVGLPIRTAGCDAAVCAMALMVVPLPDATLGEIRRVVRAGGTVAVLVPSRRPLTLRDTWRYARLLLALRRWTIPFPQPDVVTHPERVVERAGFAIVTDERRVFRLPVLNRDAADGFVDSLYLPAITDRRRAAARAVVRQWQGSDIGLPFRRVIATRCAD